ncbi:hypothetical protein GGS24DRAFT_231339 [Hypoxylon argillaceum]|nr:hypothetical protein GGS24DRAFT_231339 [Hypoxylon argillaceum]
MPSPIAKATLASVALSGTSNILAQILQAYREDRPLAFDGPDFLRFVTVTFLATPPNYLWQQLLERTFPAYERRRPGAAARGRGSDSPRDLEKQVAAAADEPEAGAGPEPKPKLNLRNTFAKWFIDCITVGAILNTVAFLVLMGMLKRLPVAVIAHKVRTETVPIIVAGYKIWPLASIISFACLPVERRIVFLNFIGLLWGIYMSLVAARV